jgi:hypothetical protein
MHFFLFVILHLLSRSQLVIPCWRRDIVHNLDYNIIVQWPLLNPSSRRKSPRSPIPPAERRAVSSPSPAILLLASSPLPDSARTVPKKSRSTPHGPLASAPALVPPQHARSPKHRATHLSRHRALSHPPAQSWQPSSPFPSI